MEEKTKRGRGQANLTYSTLSRSQEKKKKKCKSSLLVDFIKDYRKAHPGVGKETIKPELDRYCEKIKITSVSLSTIGRVLKDLKEKGLILDSSKKLSFYAKSGKFFLRKKKRKKKKRRKGYRPEKGGDLVQMDSITIFLDGIKRYIITSYDLKTGFAFAYAYSSLSSSNATDFIKKLRRVFLSYQKSPN